MDVDMEEDEDEDVNALCKMLCTQNDKVHMGDERERERGEDK